ncbi:hypothetical protein [Nonomuraea basaltis]|uniref:hypothetical protein n=1 Tax=Nonomuraea basaltis TaxID=2495887 RepID=UPI00197DC646|nr:hypothetical protein [Nonomuraea basaltis]
MAPGGIDWVALNGSHGPTVLPVNVTPWAGGERRLNIRIVPHQTTGRRIHGI